MYTQCPECKQHYPISIAELRNAQTMVKCDKCDAMYDVLELLNDGDIPQKTSQTNDKSEAVNVDLEIPKNSETAKKPWGLGYGFCLILFIFQIYFFEAYTLSQNTSLRPWLQTICSYLNCQLPPYKNPDEFAILHGSFQPSDNNTYLFKTAFTNQSAFKQAHPSIKLTLIDFTGLAFAERVFHPQDYSTQTTSLIEPEVSAEITMSIAMPSKKIGGYRFELI